MSGTRDAQRCRQVAVIDCGSTEVRALVAEVTDGACRLLEDLSADCDLSDGFAGGTITRSAMESLVSILVEMRRVVDGYGVDEVRAVATSALIEAANADVVIERVRMTSGIVLEVIEAARQAEVYYQALDNLCQDQGFCLSGDVLAVDIGGGTSVVSLIRGNKLVHAIDEHFSTRRSIEAFTQEREAIEFVSAIDRFCHGAARVMVRRLPSVRHPSLIITGREPRHLATRLFGQEPGGRAMTAHTVDRISAWYRSQIGMTAVERAAHADSDPQEADEMLIVAALITHLAQLTGSRRVYLPRLRLCDGLLLGFLADPRRTEVAWRRHLLAAGRQLAVRYGTPRVYANNTARLARQIFEGTKVLHGMGLREQALLEFAALVHDVGSHINVRSRHKHSYYIVRHADIPGLDGAEQEVVAQIARYHRRSPPQTRHLEFAQMSRRQRVVVSTLAAILRLAYALDVERSQRIVAVRCQLEPGLLLLQVDRRDVTLERWSVRDKAQLFSDVFGLRVAVHPAAGEA